MTNRKWGKKFASALNSEMSGNYIVTQQYFEDESHGTVALPGWYHGFKLLLSASPSHCE